MISPLGAINGDIFISPTYFAFIAVGRMATNLKHEKYMSEKGNNRLIKKLVIYKWTEIEEVFKRKFLNR
jgi:hypothetical protein